MGTHATIVSQMVEHGLLQADIGRDNRDQEPARRLATTIAICADRSTTFGVCTALMKLSVIATYAAHIMDGAEVTGKNDALSLNDALTQSVATLEEHRPLLVEYSGTFVAQVGGVVDMLVAMQRQDIQLGPPAAVGPQKYGERQVIKRLRDTL